MSNALEIEYLPNSLLIRFNRPEIRSPLSLFVLRELHEIFDSLIAENEPPNVVFTGKENVFASGADLREIARLTSETAREFGLYGQSLMEKISQTRAVAAVNGYCFGGALDLALACRKRIASGDAQFSHPGANLGIMTGWGGTQRLPRLVGQGAALEMFFTAKRVSAAEALRIGLIDLISTNPLRSALELLAE